MMIILRSSHLHITADMIKKLFDDDEFVFIKYVEESKKLLLAPVSSAWFAKMYSPDQFLLKARNNHGDKTIAIKPILLDFNLDMNDRELTFDLIEKTQILKINL